MRSAHTCDDGTGGTPIKFTTDMLVPGGLIAAWTKETQLASQKLVDESVTHPPEAEITENICPNMTNKEFAVLVMALRDEAIALVAERLQELERWDKVSHHRIFEWFGNPGLLAAPDHLNEMREYLRKGLAACDRILRAIGLEFCELSRDRTIFGSKTIRVGDSKLLTLVHEVTHFNDTFGSTDDWYGTSHVRGLASQKERRAAIRVNADSIASYILGVTAEASV